MPREEEFNKQKSESPESQGVAPKSPEVPKSLSERLGALVAEVKHRLDLRFGSFKGRRSVAERSMGGVPMSEQGRQRLDQIDQQAQETLNQAEQALSKAESDNPNSWEEELGDDKFYEEVMKGRRLGFPFTGVRHYLGYDSMPAPESIKSSEEKFEQGMTGVADSVLSRKILEADERASMAEVKREEAKPALDEMRAIAKNEQAGSVIDKRTEENVGRDAIAQRMIQAVRDCGEELINTVRAEDKLGLVGDIQSEVVAIQKGLEQYKNDEPEKYATEMFAQLDLLLEKRILPPLVEYVASAAHAGEYPSKIEGFMQNPLTKSRAVVQGYMYPMHLKGKLSGEQSKIYFQRIGEVKALMDYLRIVRGQGTGIKK